MAFGELGRVAVCQAWRGFYGSLFINVVIEDIIHFRLRLTSRTPVTIFDA
jgi:hypothetical protein